jgi:hypothetical protein
LEGIGGEEDVQKLQRFRFFPHFVEIFEVGGDGEALEVEAGGFGFVGHAWGFRGG